MKTRPKSNSWCWIKVLSLVLFFVVSTISTTVMASDEIKRLEGEVAAKPENTSLRVRLGRLYLGQNNTQKAIEHFKEAVAANPSTANLSLLANAYKRSGNFVDEIRTLEVLAQKQSKEAPVFELLARAYFSSNNYDKSAESFRKSISLNKKRLSAYEGLYDVFTKTNNNYERRALLNDMQDVFGDSAEVSTKLCRLFSQDNFIEKGLDVCKKAIGLNPKIPDNHVFLALNYKSAKETEQSLKIVHTAAKNFSRSEFAQFTAGTMNDEIKNYETARYYYRRCVKVDKKSDRCWAKLAQASLQLKDYKESLSAFETACKINSRAHYTEFRNATTTVRIQRQSDWVDKFQNAVEKCGISEN